MEYKKTYACQETEKQIKKARTEHICLHKTDKASFYS